MNITVTIGGVDATGFVVERSLKKDDVMTSQVDTLTFNYKKYGTKTFLPVIGDEVIVTDTDTSTVMFGGNITEIAVRSEAGGVAVYDVTCTDYSSILSGELIATTYVNKTVKYIIDDILPAGFTSNNVLGDITIKKIVFNYQSVDDCIKKMASIINYNWYVDYSKDVHFFAKNQELSPFNIDNNLTDVIVDSLEVERSNSQLINSIYVIGGDYVGNSRDEIYNAVTDQTIFPLANKFSSKPTVTLNSVAVDVGVDNLQTFTDGFDVLWSYGEKYIRFENALTSGDVVEITGTPLIPVIVKLNEPSSIGTYGIRQLKIDDASIKDIDTAKQVAKAKLEAYKNGTTSGKFSTYTGGLRSGQTITINNSILGIDESFLIKKVSTRFLSNAVAVYTATIVSYEVVGIIELLQDLLNIKNELTDLKEDVVLTKIEQIIEEINVVELVEVQKQNEIEEDIEVEESIEDNPMGAGNLVWVYGYYMPTSSTDTKRMAKADRGAKYN